MKNYLVIGNPIKHSQSPQLHNFWINQHNLDANYNKKLIDVSNLKEIVEMLKTGKLDGLNVTVPFKQDIIPLLDKLSPEAEKTQSVNTVHFEDNKLIGHNTDIAGFELAIRHIKYDVRDGLSAPDTSTIVEGENVFIYKVNEKNKVMKTKVIIGDRYLGFVEILDGLNNGDKIVAEGTKKVRPNLTIRPIEKGAKKKQGNSSWGKKKKERKGEAKKGKFDWIKNIFKKSEKEKK